VPGGAALARPVKSCHINGLALSPHCRVAASPYPAYQILPYQWADIVTALPGGGFALLGLQNPLYQRVALNP